MHAASFSGNVDILKYLLQFERHNTQMPTTTTSLFQLMTLFHQTPLHLAAFDGQDDCIQFLLRENAQMIPDVWGASPLHLYLCCKNRQELENIGSEDTVKPFILQDEGAVHWKDINRLTPLFLAVRCGEVNITRILLEHGADLNICDIYGLTPVDHAGRGIRMRHMDEKLSAMLQNISAELQKTVMNQMIRGDVVVDSSLRNAVDVESLRGLIDYIKTGADGTSPYGYVVLAFVFRRL